MPPSTWSVGASRFRDYRGPGRQAGLRTDSGTPRWRGLGHAVAVGIGHLLRASMAGIVRIGLPHPVAVDVALLDFLDLAIRPCPYGLEIRASVGILVLDALKWVSTFVAGPGHEVIQHAICVRIGFLGQQVSVRVVGVDADVVLDAIGIVVPGLTQDMPIGVVLEGVDGVGLAVEVLILQGCGDPTLVIRFEGPFAVRHAIAPCVVCLAGVPHCRGSR